MGSDVYPAKPNGTDPGFNDVSVNSINGMLSK